MIYKFIKFNSYKFKSQLLCNEQQVSKPRTQRYRQG